MKKLLQKLIGISITSTVASLVGFVTTYLIVRLLSIEVLGDMTIFLSLVGMSTLIYVIIPANYSVFKIQEDKSFGSVLFANYLLISILYLLLAYVICNFFYSTTSFLLFYLYGIGVGYLNYYDVLSQAEGNLKFYFNSLLVIAILKLLAVIVISYLSLGVVELIMVYSIIQLFFVVYILISNRQYLYKLYNEPAMIISPIFYMRGHIMDLKSYYLNVTLKKLRTNSLVLFFSPFTSAEVIGLYSLFIKSASFVNGQFRTIEAFFMKKDNIENFRKVFKEASLGLSLILFFLSFLTGILYLRINIGRYYFFENLILATLSFSYIKFLYVRAEMLSDFNNMTLNASELLFVAVIGLSTFYTYSIGSCTLITILMAYYFATSVLQIYTVINSRKNDKKFIN